MWGRSDIDELSCTGGRVRCRTYLPPTNTKGVMVDTGGARDIPKCR